MINVSDMATRAGWWSAVSRRVRERDIRRQILYNDMRKASVRHMSFGRYVADRIPVLLPEFLKMMMGAVLGFWIIAKMLASLFHADPLYILPVFGLVYSLQATYYKYRLSRDPGYKIPKCRCAGRQHDNTEVVLQSRASVILNVPHSVLGAVLYSALVLLVYGKHADTAMQASIVAVLASVYLSYVMVVKIASLCVNCINVAALNVLILWQFLR